MFEEKLILMNKSTQSGPAGPVVTWSEGAEIEAKLSISNMQDVLIAQAQGVIPTGYLVADKKFEKYITLDTYLKYPKGNFYVRIADTGIVEAGEGVFNERQFAVEVVKALPR